MRVDDEFEVDLRHWWSVRGQAYAVRNVARTCRPSQRGIQLKPVGVSGRWFQGGVGLQDRSDFGFAMVGAHLGKVLTPELGTGLFKGNFEYAVEVFPFWQSYTHDVFADQVPYGSDECGSV